MAALNTTDVGEANYQDLRMRALQAGISTRDHVLTLGLIPGHKTGPKKKNRLAALPSVLPITLFSLALAAFPLSRARAQDAPIVGAPVSDASAVTDALTALQSTFPEINSSVAAVELHKWKVPSEVKSTASSDIQSIVRDLNGTLPGLVTQAQASPGTIAPVFAVYRNLDALYDVLLRVTETATLAGSQQESSRLESARADLQSRRSQLGNAMLSAASAQDTSVVQLRSALNAIERNPGAPSSSVKKIVVNDGPDTTKTTHKKKPAAAKPASPAPNPQQ